MEQQLEPQFIGLVNDNKEQFVVRWWDGERSL
jgi:hypothetical protein